MIIQIILLIVGFAILIKGADWLVNGSVSIAKRLNVSELAIGLTIVAFGTSAPELVVNIISSLKGANDITIGNIVGSNLFNLLLILGLSGLIFPLSVQVKTVWREIPLSLFAAVLLFILANYSIYSDENMVIDRLEGIILLLFFLFFLYYIYKNLKTNNVSAESEYSIIKPSYAIGLVVVGLVSLILGSRLVVDNSIKIAQVFGISEKIIGLTIISAGTSLPELVTSLVAAYRKKSDIAIGNIIGSNIFNILLILGICSNINPIAFNISFNIDLIVLIVSTILLLLFMYSGTKYKLDRWEAGVLLIIYIGYLTYILSI